MKSTFKIYTLTFLICLITCKADARLKEHWDYKRLSQEAELIVIAVPIENQKGSEVAELPGVSPKMTANWQTTTLLTLTTLKGNLGIKTFKLHHYYLSPKQFIINGPVLVDFDLSKKMPYIMFLKKESENTYIPVSSQMDSADSIKQIGISPYSDEYIQYLLEEPIKKEK